MRKTIVAAVIIFPLAFIFGVVVQESYVRALAQYVSPCTVTKHRSLYKTLRRSDIVSVRGFLYGGEVLYLADKELSSCGENVVGVEVPEDGKIAFESQALIIELRRLSVSGKVARAEFEVIGILGERERECFASQYVIKVQQIFPVGPVEIVDSSGLAQELKTVR